jgi:sulfate transport system permease protein
VLISGNLPFKTEVASSWIYSLTQSGAPNALPAASAVSVVLIAISLLVLVAIGWARRRFEVPETI